MYPYTHPQHHKVLKYFAYIQYGCGVQSLRVCSLNHDTSTSYRLGHTPFFLKFTPTSTCNTSIRMHPYAHPQHLKVLKYFAYIWHGWDAVNGGLEPQPWHRNIIQARPYPIFPEIHPHLHMICPSTAPQGAKTLCINAKWMWDAVNGGFQPYYDTTTSYRLGHPPFFLQGGKTYTVVKSLFIGFSLIRNYIVCIWIY